MNIKTEQNGEAQEIVEALQQIQDSPELKAEAATNPESLLDRLKLSGIARHAVALGITAMLAVPTVVHAVSQLPAGTARANNFWQ